MTDLRALFDQAIEAEDARLYDRALQLYDAILREDERHPDALYNRGVVRFRRGELEVAAKDFERTTVLFPDAAHAHYNLGVCLRDMAERGGTFAIEGVDGSTLVGGEGLALTRRAMEAFSRAIELEPSGPRYMNRAVLRRSLADHEGAVEDARAALALGDAKARLFLQNEYKLGE